MSGPDSEPPAPPAQSGLGAPEPTAPPAQSGLGSPEPTAPPAQSGLGSWRRRSRLAWHAAGVMRPVFIDKVDRDHRQSDEEFRRRRIVVAITLVVGATLLGLSFATDPGDSLFYPLALGLAATWILGSVTSGPLHLGHIELRGVPRRPVMAPIAVGLLLAGIFVLGGLVTREIPFLASFTEDVLSYARYGILPVVAAITVVNGIAEELFFRGALFAGIGVRHPVAISTTLYTLATVAAGNPVLIFAAAVLGTVVALERRASGGVLGPILTHLTWSLTMLFVLPVIFPG